MASSARPSPLPSPRAPLSRERILEAGMDLIATRGVEALTMRSLADAIGTSPMSLYRHVRNKDDLLFGIASLALDQLQLEIPADGEWAVRAAAWMRSLRRQLLAHPAAVPTLMLRGEYAPAFLRATSTLLRIVLDAGFEGRAAVVASREIMWATMGFVTAEIRSPASATQASQPDDAAALPYALLGELPAAAAAEIAALIPHLLERDMDEVFEASIRHLLTGLASDLEPVDTN